MTGTVRYRFDLNGQPVVVRVGGIELQATGEQRVEIEFDAGGVAEKAPKISVIGDPAREFFLPLDFSDAARQFAAAVAREPTPSVECGARYVGAERTPANRCSLPADHVGDHQTPSGSVFTRRQGGCVAQTHRAGFGDSGMCVRLHDHDGAHSTATGYHFDDHEARRFAR